MLPVTWSKIGVVILAAGKGTRLGCVDKPKVMSEIGGRPIVAYTVETLLSLGLGREQICLVVGFCQNKIREYFGESVVYPEQAEQRGTAHAAFVGMQTLPKHIVQVLVLGGDDSAFYRPSTLQDFVNEHIRRSAALSLLTVELTDPNGYGRIIRQADGRIEVIEKEYLTPEQEKILEVSTGTFCFDRHWFESMFPSMPLLRKINEYGLPTALAVARAQGVPYSLMKLKDPDEWFGVNRPEELFEADRRKRLGK